MNIKNTMIP
jgi:hypothetical protein